jgi:hypothetical protein
MKRVPRLNEILEILVLSSFAMAQPLFDLLSRNVEFFVAHRSERLDIILLVFGICLLPAILIAMVETLAGFVGRKCQQGLHAIVIVVLTAAILLPALKIGGVSGKTSLVAAILLGIAFRWPASNTENCGSYDLSFARSGRFSLFSIPLSVYKLSFSKEVTSVAAAKIGAPATIVMVIFDEFPLASLLDKTRHTNRSTILILALSKAATWYRNANRQRRHIECGPGHLDEDTWPTSTCT